MIGGAGGKLNLLKLRGVKSESEYKSEFSERASAKRAAKREQIRKDKELGDFGKKQEARECILKARKAAQSDFVKTVAESMGWGAEKLTPAAAKKAGASFAAELLSKAKAAVAQQRAVLVADADRRASAGLGGSVPSARSCARAKLVKRF